MKYINGVFNYRLLENEKMLCLKLSEEKGQPLESAIPIILQTYKNNLDIVLFQNIPINQIDIIPVCKELHNEKIKTAIQVDADDASVINKRLFDLLDYVFLRNNKVLKKDYCPFADAYDWIEM